MGRPSFLAFALAATALLVVGVSDARADTETSAASAAEPATTGVLEAPVVEPAPVAPVTPDASTSAIQTATSVASASSGTQVPQVPAVQVPAVRVPVGTTAGGGATPAGTTAASPAQTTPPSVPASQTSQTSSSASQATPVVPARPTSVTSETPAATRETTSTIATVPVAAPGVQAGPVPAAGIEHRPGVILERLLPDVERRLRGVQAQIGHLQRRLAVGASPPPRSLMRLRLKLELIAPALVALEARVDATGQLSPHLRHLLDRVHTHLDGTRASAAALATALRQSGLRGPEVELLLRELADFQAVDPGLLPDLRYSMTHPTSAVNVADAPARMAPEAAPVEHAAPPPERHAASRRATASERSGPPDRLAPTASAPGSASASPSGGFSAAGIAALAALLCGLALPQLLSRVQLPPMRCYAATFLVPLERPG
jgi:hypothetical protein